MMQHPAWLLPWVAGMMLAASHAAVDVDTRVIELEAHDDGAFDLLHKPFEMDELLVTIKVALGLAEADAA